MDFVTKSPANVLISYFSMPELRTLVTREMNFKSFGTVGKPVLDLSAPLHSLRRTQRPSFNFFFDTKNNKLREGNFKTSA